MTDNEAVVGAMVIQMANQLTPDGGPTPDKILIRTVGPEHFAVQIWYPGEKHYSSFYATAERTPVGYLESSPTER